MATAEMLHYLHYNVVFKYHPFPSPIYLRVPCNGHGSYRKCEHKFKDIHEHLLDKIVLFQERCQEYF